MIGAIALMALLLIAGSGGGGGGGGGASTASNNNVGWKDINSSSEKDTLINEFKDTAEYQKNPILKSIQADRAYAALKLNGKATGGNGVVIGLGIANNQMDNANNDFRDASGIDFNNSLVANSLYKTQFDADNLNPSAQILTLDTLKNMYVVVDEINYRAYFTTKADLQKNARENFAINSANIIAGVRGQNTSPLTDTHGIAYDAKIAQVFYRFKYTSGSRNGIASSNSVDLSAPSEWGGYQPIHFEFENIKSITTDSDIKIYNHLASNNVIPQSNDYTFYDANDGNTYSAKTLLNSTLNTTASNVLMIAPTGTNASGKVDFLADVARLTEAQQNTINNLIFVAPLDRDRNIENTDSGLASQYRTCNQSYLKYCMGAYNSSYGSESYKYLKTNELGYNGDQFLTNPSDPQNSYNLNFELAQSSVTGAAAVLLGAWPQLTPQQIRDILFESGDKPSISGSQTITENGKSYNSVYGNSILNLFNAVQSAGPKYFTAQASLSGSTPSLANGYVLDNTSSIATASIFGDSFVNNVAPQLNDAVYFDKYNRDYKASLGSRFSTNNQSNSFNLNNFAFNNVENKSTSLAFGENKQAQIRFNISQFKDKNAKNNVGLKHLVIDRSIDPQANLANSNGFAFSYQPTSLSSKLKFGFAFNSDEISNIENKEFGSSGFIAQGGNFNSNPYQSFFNSTSVANSSNNPLLNTSRKFNQAFVKHNILGEKLAVKFSYQTSFDNTGQSYALIGKKQNQAINFGLDLKSNKNDKISITLGEMKEMDNNILNSKATGLFENTGNARTSFVKIASTQNIVDHLNLTSTVSEGITRLKGNDRGVFRSYDNIHSRSLSFALQYDGITNNKFGMAYSQPMRVYKGKVNYDYAVGINSDSSLIRRQGSASLVPNGKQQDYEVFYQHNLDKNSQLRLNLMMQKELNNFKSAPTNYVGYLSFGSNF
jgi:hypothetical protein